jgi:hypothetical protein
VQADITRGMQSDLLKHRVSLRLVGFLNLVAVWAALAELWLQRRVGKPPPRLHLEW